MANSWAESVNTIRSDQIHGASYLYALYLQVLTDHLSHRSKVISENLSSIMKVTATIHPEMAPFHYLYRQLAALWHAILKSSDTDGLKEQLLDLLTRLQSENMKSVEAIAQRAKPLLSDGLTIFCHSYSGTALKVVGSLSASRTTVLISEGRPANEGITFAKELASKGFSVRVFPDDAKLIELNEAQAVVLGSDWVSESEFVNKIGTHSIAMAAKEWKIPVYVVADLTKLIPAKMRSNQRVVPRKTGRLIAYDHLFEATPNSLITRFVTESNSFTPKRLLSYFETRWH